MVLADTVFLRKNGKLAVIVISQDTQHIITASLDAAECQPSRHGTPEDPDEKFFWRNEDLLPGLLSSS